MKTKFGKLNFSAKNLKNCWLNIVGIVIVVSIIVFGIYMTFDIKSPDPIQVDVSGFGGKIMTRNEVSGLQSPILINTSFDEAVNWGSDAILVYNSPSDQFTPDIQIYRPYQQICGTFQYASYSKKWKTSWKTNGMVYDNNRKMIICYAEKDILSFWVWRVVLIIALIMVLIKLYQDLAEKLKN